MTAAVCICGKRLRLRRIVASMQISEKLRSAKDGEIYLNAEDMQPIMEAIREGKSMGTGANAQPTAGTNFDLQV